jgi:peptide/nickel transport system substrate-binding protein
VAWIRSRALLVLLLATGAGGCAGPEPRTGTPARGGEIVASLRSEPGNYNRYFEATAPAEVVSLLTHARLVRVNRVTDDLEPALAESWTPSPDGLTYTLALRRDVRF